MASTTRRAPDHIDALFVQIGSAFSAHEGEITLHGLADATVYFSDRPRREVGHMASSRFLELWDGADAAFRIEPPQAVLSFLDDPADALADVVLLLHEPLLADHELTYRVDVLNGTLPIVGGGCSLFIDSFGQSLAPVAVRGLRRPRRTVANRTA